MHSKFISGPFVMSDYVKQSIKTVLHLIPLLIILALSACEDGTANTPNVDVSKDSDSDGVNDDVDQCPSTPPNTQIDNTGCTYIVPVDTDADGIVDGVDVCPNTAANQSVNTTGCSSTQLIALQDDDNDGVPNPSDTCPATQASATVDSNGCSSSQLNTALDDDNDGVSNPSDTCPATPLNTTVDTNGCSQDQLSKLNDTDQDGVPNNLDQCAMTQASLTVNAAGCAQNQLDNDNDGVFNDVDQCPATMPSAQLVQNGCSQAQIDANNQNTDTDNDGVANTADQCPSTPANSPVDVNGCADSQKDSDQDSVNDDKDTCPNTAASASVNANGCAPSQLDDDNDGVSNDKDMCLNTAANTMVNAQGCVEMTNDDTDFDGVKNTDDQCPNTLPSESVNAQGCAQNQLDTDKDGVSDADDFCGGTYVGSPIDAKGCSDIELGKTEYISYGCNQCHGDNGEGGLRKQIQTCSKTDCTDQQQLTTYIKNNMPTGSFGQPSDCDATCSDLIAKYMIDTFVTFSNDDDKDGVKNAADNCDDTSPWLRDQADNNGCTAVIMPPVGGTSMYVNAGGVAFLSGINESFVADDFFTGGMIYRSMDTVSNTADQELFQTERFGEFEYEIPMDNGEYEVALYFAETFYDEVGKRVFDISLEGNKVLTNFDIYKDANAKNKASYKKFQVTISDGGLSISSTKKIDNPKINAIKIYPNGAPDPAEIKLPLQSVGIGPYASCAINASNKTVCWGSNFMIGNSNGKACKTNPNLWGQDKCLSRAVPPNNLGNVLALSGTHTSACAILPNKTVRCWGPAGRIPQYPNASNVIQLSHGDRQTCALSSNGAVKCWKVDGNLSDADASAHNVPQGLVAKAISSGARMSCAIKSDDSSVVCFSYDASIVKNPPANLKAKSIEVGGWNGGSSPIHACAIDLDDNVVCWGDGAGSNAPNGLKAKSITSAEKFSCAVKLDGSAQCWGNYTNNFSNSKNNLAIFAQRDAGAVIKNDGTLIMFKQHGKNDVMIPAGLKVKLD